MMWTTGRNPYRPPVETRNKRALELYLGESSWTTSPVRNAGVFSCKGEKLGCTTTVYHRIHADDNIPVSQWYRWIPPNQFEVGKEHLQVLLEDGLSDLASDHASPIVLVSKKSGAFHLCMDYHPLNAKTTKNAHPLTRIDESLDAFGRAQYFSAIDLAPAYNQMEVHPDGSSQDSIHHSTWVCLNTTGCLSGSVIRLV